MYPSPSFIRVIKSRMMRWVGHGARIGEVRSAYKIWSENLKSPLGRPRLRWEDNIKMDLGETGWEDMDWINKRRKLPDKLNDC
jgi:hypothetical protein